MRNKEDLLRKLRALAIQGIDGEKENAQQMLDKLMKKYNIDPQYLDDDVLNWVEIKVKKGYLQKELLIQVVLSCISTYKRKNTIRTTRVAIELTKFEEIEIRAKYEFYSKRMFEDVSILFNAFLSKNNLFYRFDDAPKSDIKPIDKQKAYKIYKMMDAMDKHTYHKQLEEVKS